jgi:hypothetical protein
MTDSIYGDYNSDDVKYDAPGLPVGIHKVMITAESREPTKDGSNELLKVTFQSVEGDSKGKTHMQRYNLWNSNPKAANIAKQEIKRIGDATGRAVNAEAPLKSRVLNIEIGYQKGSDQYTEIKRYLPITD